MNKKNLVIIAVAATCAVAGAAVGIKNAPAPVAAGAVGELFAQSMNDAAGKAQALSMYKGKALVVNFWAPWCAPCVKEMPELSAFAGEAAKKNIGVIGIGVDSPANIAQFASKVKVTYPLYVAGMSGTDLSRGFGNKSGSLPYTVLIGADGKVKKTYLGQIRFAELKADLAKL